MVKTLLLGLLTTPGFAQVHYEPTLQSLNQHPLPQWYADAKLGIFIHYGLYSVPGWAPLSHPEHDFRNVDYIKNNPYAEWYYNVMRIDGSPTQAYHREHYGANYNYYNFAPIFDQESMKWKPEQWATIFHDAGAKYVVLTTKHHEGFTLWPSSTPNPTLPKDRQHATRDIVGELTTAVNKQGMRMGLYYSGGYDWTFVPGPIRTVADYQTVKPQSAAYGKYADAQIKELIVRYHPAVLWNDIDWPKSGRPLEIMADYYNTVPDGVVDDRFGVKHSDFTSPEYEKVDEIRGDQVGRMPRSWPVFWLQSRRGRGTDHRPRRIDLPAGGYCQQERQSAAGCWPRGGWNHSTGTDGAVARAGRMATSERGCYLRHATLDAGYRQNH